MLRTLPLEQAHTGTWEVLGRRLRPPEKWDQSWLQGAPLPSSVQPEFTEVAVALVAVLWSSASTSGMAW